MSENEQTSIDLSVNADSAMQTIQELTAAARQADTELQKLKQTLLDQFNALPRGSLAPASSYSEAFAHLQDMDAGAVQGISPEIARTSQRIQARQADLHQQVTEFVTANPDVVGQPAQSLLAPPPVPAQQPQAQATLPNPGGATYYQQSARSGPAVPPQMQDIARYGYDTVLQMRADAGRQSTSPLGNTNTDTTQQDRGATLIGERFAQALTRSAGGLISGGVSGAFNAAGMGATGDLVSGLARPLMGLLGEFAAPLAAVAAVGAGALAVNNQQAHYADEQQSLSGAVGTTTGATPLSVLRSTQNVGWNYLYGEKQSVTAAEQLGQQGIQSSQMPGALNDAMALARISGLSLPQTTSLTGGLMQSGMSGNQVGDYFAQLDRAARQSGVSVARLTEGIVHLNQAAGVGQILVNGLAAAQALTDQSGTKIDIAQAMSGAIGATGTTALAQGALLGLSPTQFEAATQDPAKLLDAYGNLAKRYDVGSGGVLVAQQAMSAAGFDFSKMDSHQADVFTRKLVAQGPGAAQAYEDSLTKKENARGAPGPHNAGDLYKQGVDAAQRISSFLQQAEIHAEKIAADLLLAEHSASAPLAALTPYQHDRIIADARKRGPEAQLAMIQHAPSAAVRAARLLGYEAITSGQDYANDPNAPAGIDTSRGGQFGPVSEYQMSQYRQSGVWLGGGPGKGSFVPPDILHAYEQSARRTGDPLAELLSQGQREATVNGRVSAGALSPDGGVGLGQWTPGPHNENLPTIEKYLGAASKDLGLGPVTAANWREAALNPGISALGTGLYDRDLYKESGGSWEKALTHYAGGNNPNAQAQAYGLDVNANAQKIEIQLGGSIDITHSGVKVGTGQVGTHIQARTSSAHSIDTSKKHVASQSYAPDQRPPSPGLPNLPGHIK